MSGGVLGIGVSALFAARRGLEVTAHNVANAGTEGYSRERMDLSARPPAGSGFAAVGRGVSVDGISRVVDTFVNLRLGMRLSDEAHASTLAQYAKQVDNLLGDSSSGLAPALQSFFGAVQDLASNPTSAATRQQLISEGRSLLDRFQQLQSGIDDQRAIMNGRIRSDVKEINQLASGVAHLNQAIIEAGGHNAGAAPNDLLDKRDQLIRELSKHVSVSTTIQSDGSMNVYVGKGAALVLGVNTTALQVRSKDGDPNRLQVGYTSSGSFIDATKQLTGGELGALFEVQGQVLDPATNGLGRIALAVTEKFNAVHRLNMNLDGQTGQDFFDVGTLPVFAMGGNAATGDPVLSVNDVNGLKASNYELRFDGTNWNVTRLSDGQNVASTTGGTVSFDGLTLDLSGVTGAAADDRYILRPMQVTDRLRVAITDPRQVAAALPVRAEAATANTGTASVQHVSVSSTTPNVPVSITFTGGQFMNTGLVPPAPIPTSVNSAGDTVLNGTGWDVTLRGTPAEGDVFNIQSNAGGVGDNRGALALANLQTAQTMAGGSASFGDAYGGLVAKVGVTAQRSSINAEVQGRLLDQATAARESVSGVSLDEEAANLMRYRQAYQAAAQVISAAGNMIDTLLSVMR